MPYLNWSQISHLQLGKIAEHLAQVEFLSHGYEVYDTVVDDRGIDFVVRKNSNFYEIQVKAVRNYNYTFISRSKMKLAADRLICYLNFVIADIPRIYLIPTTAWQTPNDVLIFKEYEGKKSPPEYGICNSRKNQHLLDQYEAEKAFSALDAACNKEV